jgi:hypothetical protein
MKRFLFSFIILPISVLAEGGLPDKPYIYVVGKAEVSRQSPSIRAFTSFTSSRLRNNLTREVASTTLALSSMSGVGRCLRLRT